MVSMRKFILILSLISVVFVSGCISTAPQDNSRLITKSTEELLPTQTDMADWTFSEKEALNYGRYSGFDSGSLLRIVKGSDIDSVMLIKISKWNSTDAAAKFYDENRGKIKEDELESLDGNIPASQCFAFRILMLSNIMCANKNIIFELSAMSRQKNALADMAKLIESKI